MSYTDSPELIASRLSSEIRDSESTTRSLIFDAESRLRSRIHELEMSSIDRSRSDFVTLALIFVFCTFFMAICLSGHSHESSNTEPTSQAAHAEASTPAKEEGQ